MKHLINNI